MPGQAPETFAELLFPTFGLHVVAEFELQPQGTTVIANNVRGYEPSTGRQRGGARSGLTQYVPQQVSGTNKIQNMNVVTNTNATALLAEQDPEVSNPAIPDADFVLDPSTSNLVAGGYVPTGPGAPFAGYVPPAGYQSNGGYPGGSFGYRVPPGGRLVLKGGSGIQPNRNGATSRPGGSILFVQQKSLDLGPGVVQPTISLTFTNPVGLGDFLLVAAQGNVSYTNPNTVSDNLGSVWTQLTFSDVGNGFGQIWWALAAHAGSCTVTVTGGSGSNLGPLACALEYAGVKAASPIGGLAFNTFFTGGGGTATPYTAHTTSVPVTGTKNAIIGLFYASDDGNAASPFGPGSPVTGSAGSGTTARVQQQHNDVPSSVFYLLLTEDFAAASVATDLTANLFTSSFSPEILDVESYGISLRPA